MADAGSFYTKASEYGKRAREFDDQQKFQEAFDQYKTAIQYFMMGFKYDKNTIRTQQMRSFANGYMDRAETLSKLLKGQAAPAPVQAEAQPSGTGNKKSSKEDKEKAELDSAIEGAIVKTKPDVKWDDVAGLEKAKAALKEAVIFPQQFAHLFQGKRTPWKGILLYGPPGTGKSYIAAAVANTCDSTFFSVSASDLMSKWQGQSEKLVRTLFEMARQEERAIIFIDEFDSLASARSDNDSESSKRVKTEFLVQMQGVGKNGGQVLVLAATNLPDSLDSAIRRRFEKRIFIPLPDEPARRQMFKVHLGDTPNTLTDDDFTQLALHSEGYSGSDISIVVRDALFQPIRQLQTTTHFKPTQTAEGTKWLACAPSDEGAVERDIMSFEGSEVNVPPVSAENFFRALDRVKPSVSKEDAEALANWQYGDGE
ncbi:vacuolar protein sorting-associated protein 4B [Carpediemonas membranifera]|uniref:Vacuolar protein sorting-associated protein 4B n=1 Tax=Carpediemonas membranifera TaxID=201153 RepID=A0A8J6BX25_9EUKA|nr:vacuolar protein sorting-associated protein 4B [Carpediemonas membranifera]QNO39407.1 vacuolar protein sorting 4A [Carpediemonas membranifera]|eukprot:KAG9393021.1 vacuolar protein sorting-associated protein 4B [Carpediemonas membranifera]